MIAGVGMEMLSLKPRLQTTVDNRTYKVNERVTSLSFEAHAKYTAPNWLIAGKTLLASNLTQASRLGGMLLLPSIRVQGNKNIRHIAIR